MFLTFIMINIDNNLRFGGEIIGKHSQHVNEKLSYNKREFDIIAKMDVSSLGKKSSPFLLRTIIM
jgi:hypothetical protein